MSNLVYPSLPGLMFPQQRIVIPPRVEIRTTPSDREYRARSATLNRYQYGLPYEFLRTGRRGTELQTLVGFYSRHGGPFESWLYADTDDQAVTLETFGIGNAATVAFQLVRQYGGFAEPVIDLQAAPAIYVNGVLAGGGSYSVSAGLVTFTSAPASGAVLAWTGAFYRRCRFMGDRLDTERFMEHLYRAGRVEFISTKPGDQ